MDIIFKRKNGKCCFLERKCVDLIKLTNIMEGYLIIPNFMLRRLVRKLVYRSAENGNV